MTAATVYYGGVILTSGVLNPTLFTILHSPDIVSPLSGL